MSEDRQARAKSGCASDCVDMTSKCGSVSVPIQTVLGLNDTQTGQINASGKFDYLSEASVAELSLAGNKSTAASVSFSDDYCSDTNDRGYAAFHDCKKCILQHWFVKQDCKKTTALENEAVFVVRRIHPCTQKRWHFSPAVF